MKPALALPAALCLALAAPIHAQNAEGTARFNLFALDGLTLSDIFTFDARFAERYSVDVPIPFQVDAPRDARLLRVVDGKPDGGAFVKFSYGLPAEAGTTPVLLESLQITTAIIPRHLGEDDPALARQGAAIALARDHIFPRMVEDKTAPEILTVETITLGDTPALHLIGRFVDPLIGPTLLRVVVLPHPDQDESMVAVAMINMTHVPVRDGVTLAQSLTGRILASWRYL